MFLSFNSLFKPDAVPGHDKTDPSRKKLRQLGSPRASLRLPVRSYMETMVTNEVSIKVESKLLTNAGIIVTKACGKMM